MDTAYQALASLTLSIDTIESTRLERETSSGFTRVTTEFGFSGPASDESTAESSTGPSDETPTRDTVVGRGEDVTYDAEEHDLFVESDDPFDLCGEYTLSSFSDHVGAIDLFPRGEPDQEAYRHYRRWGLESAALDLALRQAGTDLGTVVDRSYDPVRFVASTRLGDPPSMEPIDALRERAPAVELKLDPTPEWKEGLIEDLASLEIVRILDLKGQYQGTTVDVETDPDLYRRVIDAFPNAIIEDPAVTSETRSLLESPAVQRRLSWDSPIHDLDDVKALPWEPAWLNIKPSRFGSVSSVLETIAYCHNHEITMYGGGQFELGVGRGHIQTIASLWYPDAPNDVAPRAYNEVNVDETLPASPLESHSKIIGFSTGRCEVSQTE